MLFRTGIPPLVGRDPTEDRFYLDRVFPQRRGRDPELATAKGLAGNGQQLNLKKKREKFWNVGLSAPPPVTPPESMNQRQPRFDRSLSIDLIDGRRSDGLIFCFFFVRAHSAAAQIWFDYYQQS